MIAEIIQQTPEEEDYVSLFRNEDGIAEIRSFHADAGYEVHPCTKRLSACRNCLGLMRIADDILVPAGSIPVRIDEESGVADLAFYRRAAICGSRVIAVGESPADLLAELAELYRIAQDDEKTAWFFRCVLMPNCRIEPCSQKLYREACDADHGPRCATLRMDTVGEYRAGMLVSPDEYGGSPWAYAAEFERGRLEVWEVGESYNNLLHRCMQLSSEVAAWNPPIPPDCDGICEIHRCTPELYEEVCASPWYLDRTLERVPCILDSDGRFGRFG